MSRAKKLLGFIKDLKNNESLKKSKESVHKVLRKAESEELSKTKVGAAVLTVLVTVVAILEVALELSSILGK